MNAPAAMHIPLAKHRNAQSGQWYIRFRVPVKVREAFGGQRDLWRPTGKTDLEAAKIAALPELAKLKTRVARAKACLQDGTGLAELAAEWRKLKEGRGRPEQKNTDVIALDFQAAIADAAPADEHDTNAMALEMATRDAAVRTAAARFVPGGFKAAQRAATYDDRFQGDEGLAVAVLAGDKAASFLKIAVGGRKPTASFIEEWFVHRIKEVELRNAKMDRSDVEDFAKDHATLDLISKKATVAWVAKLREEDASRPRGGKPLTPSTIRRKLAALRAFWRWLQGIEAVSEDVLPFHNVDIRERGKGAVKRAREAFTPKEVAAVFKAAKEGGDDVLADLIMLAAFTGARREELCQLKSDDASGGWLKIDDAKTPSGNRMVPVHEKLKVTVTRLVKESKDGFLLRLEAENQYNGRGAGVGKRFGRLARKLGYPSTKVFHSIRHGVVTQLDDAGIEPHVVAALVGHERKDFTGRQYSGAELRKQVKKAVEKIRYPGL
ncbi:tyrosine-type recombinase/integrase [Reyranella sp. CPCC 100927]|uniref:tyrosine-type recombinase/integrase n=1 Tax=Reyranella sp. CPCC 100927 TaxID=2599616 RepID=UPI0015B52297|nr:tyrosine-type recombinase/integrase [Reyranella sp. CPCC 100927]